MQELFFELIQVALGQKESLSKVPSTGEWHELFALAQKQAVAGIAVDALERLQTLGVKPPTELLLQWIGLEQLIEQQNRIVNQRCQEITDLFASNGFRTCILKGQGNGRMYPNALRRTSGDIDIWVEGTRKEIRVFVISRWPDAQDGDMHIEFPIFNDVPVEVHYKPSFDVRGKYDKRLQEWFTTHAEEQFNNKIDFEGGQVCFPTLEFNVIHQMSHIMNHFFVEGIGMRHFVDYYYVLTNTDLTNRTDVIDTIQYLGLEKFARGVMWIEKKILGINEDYLLFEPSEKIGKLMLHEMMEGGNFGHHDQRYGLRKNGLLGRGIVDTYRLLKLFPAFPQESLWKIWNKIENQRWKL